MPIGKPYPPELRERAVRMVYEWREARETDYGGFAEVGEMLGVPPQTLTDRVVIELVEEIRRLRSAPGQDTPTAS